MAEVKNKKKDRPRPRTNKKLGKTAFRPLGRAENWKNRLSNPLDEQKTGKNSFPTPWMNRKLEKTVFQPLG